MAKGNEQKKRKGIESPAWADQMEVTENSKHNGIELLFNSEPIPELQSKLRAIGFRPSKVKNMWYSENTEAAKSFALDVQSTLTTSPAGPDLVLTPSFESTRINIEKKEFSFILITLKDDQIKNYIVFEPSKPKAEVIATRFAKEQFGDNFLALAVKSRTQVREARILFDEEKIIDSNSKPETAKKPTWLLRSSSEKLTTKEEETEKNDREVLELSTLQRFYRAIAGKKEFISRKDLDDWAKENTPALGQDVIERIWATHLRTQKSMMRYQKHSRDKQYSQPYHSIYKKLQKVVPDLIKHVNEGKHSGKSVKDPKGGLMNLNFDYLGKDKNGNYLIALSHYFEQNGDLVADPDMQIRIYPDREVAEAMTYQDQFGYQEVYPDKGDGKEYVDLRRKKELNKFLNQWLGNLLHQGHKIDLTNPNNGTEALEEDPYHYFHKAYEQLLKFIPDLLVQLKIGEEISGEFKAQEDDELRKIEYRIRPNADRTACTILLQDYTGEDKQLESDIDFEPENKRASVGSEWLSFPYVEEYDREESEEEIDERDGDIGEEMTRGLTEWLDDVLELGYQIRLQENNFPIPSLHFPEEEEVIDQYKGKGFPVSFSAQEAFDRNLPVIDLAFRYAPAMEHFREHIESPLQKQIQKLQRQLKDLGKTKNQSEKRTALKNQINELENEVRFAEKLVEDENLIFHDDLMSIILEQARQKGYSKTVSSDMSGFRDYMVTNILDNRAIENYANDPVQKVVNELLEEYVSSITPRISSHQDLPQSSAKAILTNIITDHKYLPNVLVPAGTSEPFLSQDFQDYDVESVLKTNFPNLLKINNANVLNASALELFELVQMDDPADYGIKVSKRVLKEIWEEKGKEIFDKLALPTDPNYLYIHIQHNYKMIVSLKEIVRLDNDKEIDWQKAAQYWRPIGNAKEGLQIIDELIVQDEFVRDKLKANNPNLNYKGNAKGLHANKVIIQKFIDNSQNQSTDAIKPIKRINDPLANKHGVYTEETAGENHERIIIPVPKSAQYEAEIRIVKRSDGTFAKGMNASKKFGDYNGFSYPPRVKDETYAMRTEALNAGLKEHEMRLKELLLSEDRILGNEEKKNKQLTTALNALNDFARINNISFDKKDTSVISGLEAAYWSENDDVRPLNKAVINGITFHQKRLIQLIGNKLEKLPLEVLEGIAHELSEKFEERKPLSAYDEKYVTIGKEGDARKAALIVMYVDDLIFRNDLLTIGNYPVLNFLIELLFSDSSKLADFPQHMEKQSNPKIKKQSQHELNKEIEALIDRKDLAKESFNEEEKNKLRLYAGSGGLINQGATGKGVLYEYYTPDTIIKKMWDMAYHFGYDGGDVLEPSVGIGSFFKYAPKGAALVGYEVNHYAARIAQILYPAAQIHEAAFETIFFAGNVHLKDDYSDKRYSLVIGNPPYGEFSGKYAGMGEKKWTGMVQYEHYFTFRGLDLLKSGGLLIYIVPSNFLKADSLKGIAQKTASKCTGLDRYYLGTDMFKTTDIETDIIALRKN